jgi:hypothetical protein
MFNAVLFDVGAAALAKHTAVLAEMAFPPVMQTHRAGRIFKVVLEAAQDSCVPAHCESSLNCWI